MAILDGLTRHVRAVIRTCEMKGALLRCIQKKELITYEDLASCLGYAAVAKDMMDVMVTVAKHNYLDHQPLYTAVVVRKSTGIPGYGFFYYAARLGAFAPPTEEDLDRQEAFTKDGMDFWHGQLKALGYDSDVLSCDEKPADDDDSDPVDDLIHKLYELCCDEHWAEVGDDVEKLLEENGVDGAHRIARPVYRLCQEHRSEVESELRDLLGVIVS